MYQDFLPVAIFVLLAIILLVAPLIIQALVSPRFNKGGDKLDIYECGETPEGNAWTAKVKTTTEELVTAFTQKDSNEKINS